MFTIVIITARTSDIISCIIAAIGDGSSGHGSIKEARQALKIQMIVKNEWKIKTSLFRENAFFPKTIKSKLVPKRNMEKQ